MNFIKGNIVFVIIMVITLIGSGYLIFMNIEKNITINEINTETQNSQAELDKALKRRIKPVPLNIAKIQEDARQLQKLTIDLQRIFGNPYRKALIGFAQRLKMTETELKTQFRDFFNQAEPARQKQTKVFICSFFDHLIKEKKADKQTIDNAFIQFVNDVQKETCETLNMNESAYDFFAMAMGIERTMKLSTAQNHLGIIQNVIYMQYLIPGVHTKDKVHALTFDRFVNRPPLIGDIKEILTELPIMEDIFRRMKSSGLKEVLTFKKYKNPVENNPYIIYEYTTSFISSLDAARKFTIALQNAYLDNRVYVITWVDISSDTSAAEVNKLRAKLVDSKTENNEEVVSAVPASRSSRTRKKKRRRQNTDIQNGEVLDFTDCKPLITGDKLVTVNMRFKYIVFTGEQLKINQ